MNIQRRSEFFCLFLSIVCLLIGGLIYLFFRPHTLIMFEWLESLKLEHLFPRRTFNSDSKLISFCVYSLPNGLWSISAIILFGIVWINAPKFFYIYTFLFTAGNILMELFQLFGIVSGTFDIIDVLVLLISTLAGILIYKFLLKGGYYET